jgi:FixJ family two-component response regulator
LPGIVHVVDDDASFRTAIERRLKKAGYVVATYPSAQQLLDRLPDDNELGCILLDVQIPGLSGPELQGRLAEVGSTLPIIFLTGHADTQTTVRTIKAGAEDFLTKPNYCFRPSNGRSPVTTSCVANEAGWMRCAPTSRR